MTTEFGHRRQSEFRLLWTELALQALQCPDQCFIPGMEATD
ncbi:MAG: hypothetical protein ACXWU5_07155 [Rhodoplanes sp.]